MARITLAGDFKEFLRLLNSNVVEYLLIGGYAVGVHGHVRATNDLDVWINVSPENRYRVERALRAFGFAAAELTPELFLSPNMVRMGSHVPFRRQVRSVLCRKRADPGGGVGGSCHQSGSPAREQGGQRKVEGLGRSGGSAYAFHNLTPPLKAFSLSPMRAPLGRSFRSRALPPPSTT
jgi:hypothetical protein